MNEMEPIRTPRTMPDTSTGLITLRIEMIAILAIMTIPKPTTTRPTASGAIHLFLYVRVTRHGKLPESSIDQTMNGAIML